MLRAPALLLLMLPCLLAFGQERQRLRFPLWTFHESDTRTVGLNVGVLSNEEWQRNVTTIGVRAEVPGVGLFLFMVPYLPIPDSPEAFAADSAYVLSERIHGINLSPLGSACNCTINGINLGIGGTFFHRSNGLSAAIAVNGAVVHNGVQLGGFTGSYRTSGLQLGIMSAGAYRINGVQIAAECYAVEARGVQIGLFNRAKSLKGLQIGLWNVNQKRKWPLFNWA